jgi:hypothetical protein
MKIWNEGDTCEVVCYECGTLVSATMRIRDMGFEDNQVMVRNLLVDVCDLCDAAVAVPAQATPQIRAALFEAHETARGALARSLGLPDDLVLLDLPQHPTSRSYLDVELTGGIARATFSPSEGYGLFSTPSPGFFGERPDLFLREAADAAAHLTAHASVA